ncbi:MAG: alpha/beta hydrolase [Rhodothermales bacterium]
MSPASAQEATTAIEVYKVVGMDTLRLHVFYPPSDTSSSRAPAIVFFFGGGWVNGSPEQFFPHARYFASRGMVAISAEYRIKSRHGTTPFESVEDGKSAIRWVRAHAGELGVDPERIVAAGGSAGGQVAAAAGMLDAFDAAGEDLHMSSRPQALVLFNPVIDNGPEGYGYERIGDRYTAFSPLHNVDAQSPPTVLFLGTADALIPVATATRFEALMEGAGVRCDVHLYDEQPHGFFNYRDGDNPYYYHTVREADLFLKSLGYLAGEPTL